MINHSAKEWIYIVLLAAVTVMYFFVDGMSDSTKTIITIAVFVIVVVLKFAVKTTKEDDSHV